MKSRDRAFGPAASAKKSVEPFGFNALWLLQCFMDVFDPNLTTFEHDLAIPLLFCATFAFFLRPSNIFSSFTLIRVSCLHLG